MSYHHFFRDKPLFGLDIGSSSIKVIQIEHRNNTKKNHSTVVGYGSASFNSSAIQDGVIVEFEEVAKVIHQLFDSGIIGSITTNRASVTVPAYRAYSRLVTLPSNLGRKQLHEAVMLEAEQYIPVPIDDLYVDYEVGSKNAEDTDILISAVPKKVIDSYVRLLRLVNIDPILIETTIASASRIVAYTERSNEIPTVLVDLGSLSADLTVFDKYLIVNGTVPGGSEDFTRCIANKFGISHAEAHTMKIKHGLGYSKKQTDIREALRPQLEQLIKEIRRIIRYHEERSNENSKIGQIITMGGGANMTGLTEYLTDNLRLPTRMCNFWDDFSLNRIQPPNEIEQSIYVTAAGAALVDPKRVWGDKK
jgi:type IV pilus assembly protein PilM